MRKLLMILILTTSTLAKDRVYIPYGVINGEIRQKIRAVKKINKKLRIVRYCDSFEVKFPYFYSCLSSSSDCLDLFYERIKRNGYRTINKHYLLLDVNGGQQRGNLCYGNIEKIRGCLK